MSSVTRNRPARSMGARFGLILVAAALEACTCGTSPAAPCQSGEVRDCVGVGQCAGTQACLDDQSGFGDCQCGGSGGGAGGGGGGGSSDDGGSGPLLQVAPASQDFGAVAVGTASNPVAITVTNVGASTSGAVMVALGGVGAARFSLDAGTCTAALAARESCTLVVRFAPIAAGATQATLTATATPGGSASVTLAGIGAEPAALSLSPSSYDFGAVAQGGQSASTAFTLRNTGGSPTAVVAATLAGTHAAQFALVSDSCSGQPLAAGSSCVIAARFSPSAAGSLAARLEVSAGALAVGTDLSGSGLVAGALTLTPASYDFQDVAVGQTQTQRFTVSNTGATSSGALTAPALSGAGASHFSISAHTCTSPLTASGACTVDVRYAPGAPGGHLASLVVSSASAGAAASAVSGRGLGPAALAIAPAAHSFGTLALGSAATQTFTLTNTGDQTSLSLTTTVTGADLTAVSNTCAGQTLSGGASCTVAVRFSPSVPGTRTGTLAVSAGSATATAALTGLGVAPGSITLAPTNGDFGPVLVGTTSSVLTLTATNGGAQATGVITASVPAPFGLVSDLCTGLSLSPGQSCTVGVRLSPTSAGAASGSLLLAATPGGPATAPLMGVGVTPAELAVSPLSQTFPATVSGAQSASRQFQVTNTGGQTSGAVSVAVSGSNPGDFPMSTGCAAALAPGASCTATVTFAPSSSGSRTAALTASASPGGSASAALDGTGLKQATLSAAPSPVAFGTLVVGQSATVTVTLQNTGDVATAGAPSTAITGTDAARFSVVGSTCTTPLAAGASCTFDVRFSPTSTGSRAATLTVTGSPAAALPLNLTGDALAAGALTLSATSYDFGGVVEGGGSAAQSFTVTNTGGSVSGALSVAKGGVDPTQFVTSGCAGASLGAGSSCTLTVQFSPSTPGAKQATVTVSASPGGAASLTLDGRGLRRAALAVSPSAASLGAVALGASSTFDITVQNTGEVASGQPTAALGGANAGEFSVSASTCGAGLPAAGSCRLTVRMAPASVGAKAAQLDVTATPGGLASAGLSGTGTVTVTVAKAGNGAGSVTSSPSGISCGATCSAAFSSASVTLTAAPNSTTSTFAGWGGACASAGTSPSCTLALSAAQSATANFALKRYTLTVVKTGNQPDGATVTGGGINCGLGAGCTTQVDHGSSVTLTGTPIGSDWVFKGFINAPCTGPTGTCTLGNVTSDTTVWAVVDGRDYPLVVSSPPGATITCWSGGLGGPCQPTYPYGAIVFMTLQPDANHVAGSWVGGPCDSSTAVFHCSFPMAANMPELTATAPGKPTAVPYAFTGVPGRIAMNGVEVTGMGAQSFPWGTPVSISILDDPGVYDLNQGYFAGACSHTTTTSCSVVAGAGSATAYIYLPTPPAPLLELRPSAYSFGWGAPAKTQTFVVTSAAGRARTAPLDIQVIGAAHGGYLTIPSNTAPASGDCVQGVTRLLPGQSCNVRVSFNPANNIDLDNLLVVRSNDVALGYDVQATAQLWGWINSGSQDFGATPYSLTFPVTNAGSVSAEQLFTLEAYQDELNLAFTVDTPFELGPSTTCVPGSGIPAFGSCVIGVLYHPTAVGLHRGGVHVNASAFGVKHLALSGEAVCGGAGSKSCSGSCVLATSPTTGCGDPASCAACPSATNGGAACVSMTSGIPECVYACSGTDKLCNTTCVAPAPSNGCGDPSCTPCSLANVAASLCTSGGVCDYTACSAGYEDADGARSNGCEAVACPSGTKRCGQSCVSTSDPLFGCGYTSCEACLSANGTASCDATLSCHLSCRPGFKKCGGQCVANSPATGCALGTCTPCNQVHVIGPFCGYATGLPACEYDSCEPGWVDADVDMTNGCETPAACEGNTKVCGGATVCRTDPNFGCGGPSCAACPDPGNGGLAICNGSAQCDAQCSAPYKACGGTCALMTPSNGCNAAGCGTSCAALLQHAWPSAQCDPSGACRYDSCQFGWADKDGNRSNGCETPLPTAVNDLQLWVRPQNLISKGTGPNGSDEAFYVTRDSSPLGRQVFLQQGTGPYYSNLTTVVTAGTTAQMVGSNCASQYGCPRNRWTVPGFFAPLSGDYTIIHVSDRWRNNVSSNDFTVTASFGGEWSRSCANNSTCFVPVDGSYLFAGFYVPPQSTLVLRYTHHGVASDTDLSYVAVPSRRLRTTLRFKQSGPGAGMSLTVTGGIAGDPCSSSPCVKTRGYTTPLTLHPSALGSSQEFVFGGDNTGDVLVYGHALSDSELALVDAYLKRVYGW